MASVRGDSGPPAKGHRLTVRFDAVELAQVQAAARRLEVPPSSFVRAAALSHARRDGGTLAPASQPVRAVRGDSPALDALSAELKRVGININQLARLANRGELLIPPGEDAGAIRRALIRLRDLIVLAREEVQK